jgi:threonine/homoserine/homoserine lactone efflux protein
MIEYILFGGGYALAAAIQPGPLQAFFLSSVAQRGWKRTLPAAFAPVISDGPIAFLVLFVLNQVPEIMSKVLQIAGGAFLIYLGWGSYRQWKQNNTEETEDDTPAPRTALQAAMVNLLNPHPYLGWSLVLGPAFLSAWEQRPAYAVALVIAFYGTMVIGLAGTIMLFGTTRYLGPHGRRALILISAVMLALLGVYLLASGILGARVT